MPRLLIVEDHLQLCDVLEENLKDQGFVVTVLHDGTAAQQALQSETFDAVIADAILPSGASGLDIAKSARERGIPVLIMSGWPTTIFKLSAEPYRFLQKPFLLGQLTDALRAIMPATRDAQGSPNST